MRKLMRLTLATVILLGATSAFGQFVDPPIDRPDWWVHPPDSTTRLQYHSFINNPNNNNPPDYTDNGFVPAVSDQWTFAGPLNQPVSPGTTDAYGDSHALLTSDNLTKLMGNAELLAVKEWYVSMVWSTQAFLENGTPLPINTPILDVTSPGIPEQDIIGDGIEKSLTRVRNNTWWVSVWEGTITPQPDQETFDIQFFEPTYVDSIWIGTHCVPEPATCLIFIMASGAGLVLSGRSAMRR